MKPAYFLYCYAKYYHKHNVKAVLMMENWTDKDYDVKYAKYMQEYIRIRDLSRKNSWADDKIKGALEKLKNNRLNSIYDRLFEEMKAQFKSQKGEALLPPKLEEIKHRLEKHRSLDGANFEFLRELRKIEEEIYEE